VFLSERERESEREKERERERWYMLESRALKMMVNATS